MTYATSVNSLRESVAVVAKRTRRGEWTQGGCSLSPKELAHVIAALDAAKVMLPVAETLDVTCHKE